MGEDVDVVANWPLDKIRDWMAYFEVKRRREEEERTQR